MCNCGILRFVILAFYLVLFEGLVGVDADIKAVGRKINTSFLSNRFPLDIRDRGE